MLKRVRVRSVVREKSLLAIVARKFSAIEVAFSSVQFFSKIKNSSPPQRQMTSLSRNDRLEIAAISLST